MKKDHTIKKIGGFILMSFVMALVLIGIAGVIVSKEMVPPASGMVIAKGIVICLSFVSAYLSARFVEKKKLLIGVVSSGCLIALLVFMNVLLFDGYKISLDWYAAAVFLASIPAGIISSRKKTSKRWRGSCKIL